MERGQDRTGTAGAGYYLPPAERDGEPPGTWTGRGVAELGLRPGGVVDRAVFEPLFGQHLDLRDPAGQARLGRAPGWAGLPTGADGHVLFAPPQHRPADGAPGAGV